MISCLLLSILPHCGPVVTRCDLAELNHFHDGCGKCVFTQVVWWDWRPHEAEHRVVAWRLLKTDGMRPRLAPHGEWRSLWTEGDELIEVRAASFRETWTQYDVEVHDRDELPKEMRRGLVRP